MACVGPEPLAPELPLAAGRVEGDARRVDDARSHERGALRDQVDVLNNEGESCVNYFSWYFQGCPRLLVKFRSFEQFFC